MNDLVVIMSIYINDRLEFVKESVESILNQTYPHFDYFISFDGPVSVDIDKYITSLTDGRVKLFRIEKNGGLARALNMMLEIIMAAPQYKYIARMDADDISMPTRFEKQRIFLNENTDITILGSWYEEINEKGEHLSFRRLPTEHEALRRRYFTGTPFAHPSVIYRRELIEKAGFYPTETIFMEDNLLWGRALKAGLVFANMPDFLLKFRRDAKFYERRSGFKYGWNFILTRIKVFKLVKASYLLYMFAIISGIIKMMPSPVIRHSYNFERKYLQN